MNQTPTESEEQIALFQWAEMMMKKYPELGMLYHIPNGGKRNIRTAARLRKEGVKPGVPDLCLPVPSGKYHGLYIEMKRQKGGKVSAIQDIWLSALMEYGYKTVVCCGWQAAAKVLTAYLDERRARA